MKLFVTPPIAHLELSELGNNNFYVLAQLWKHNKKYREYTQKAKEEGRFLILDSGVGDEGEVIEKEELFEITKIIRPNEVIPTDVLFDTHHTIDNCLWFIEQIKKEQIEDVDIFACPQGSNCREYLMCYDFFEKHKNIKTIGWSKKAIPHIFYPSKKRDQNIKESRIALFNHFHATEGLKKPVHCLGMGDPTEFKAYKLNTMMRSTDSCYPILAAIKGIELGKDEFKRVPTPKNYFDLKMTKKQIELAKRNVEFVKECCFQCG